MLIEAKGLSMEIQGKQLFNDISLSVKPGTSLAIIGPSGSGKTTLLNCLGLIQKPTSGSIWMDGRDFSTHKRRDVLDFWKKSASFIYQDSGVIEEESIRYNVCLRRGISRSATAQDVTSALDMVGLSGRENENAAVLSGGEKQRLGVARAIYKRASVIFADEPTASLDEKNRALVKRLLLEMTKMGCSVIIATHDLVLAQACSHVLDLGRRHDAHASWNIEREHGAVIFKGLA